MIPGPRKRSDAVVPLLLALGLGAVTAAQANFAKFLQHNGDHALCCGPRGAINLDAAVMTKPRLVALADGAPAGATASVAATPAPAAAEAPAGKKEGDYHIIGFDRLASFTFSPPDYTPTGAVAGETKSDQIPASIKALDKQKVAVAGFMLPVKMEEGLVKEFLLVKDPMACCYGMMPKVNEWIVVRMTGKGVQPLMDVPLTFYGKLRVGEMFENGYLTGIYLLEGERMGQVKG
ncbi:MAG TPA: DUF3299 domain-containing protein [Opitutaceae bacterium]|nr:DUF3299 domain-containing protein [Opitutaceae bacterium]